MLIIFNILVDAVVRAWLEELSEEEKREIDVIFYANDGRIGTMDPVLLQKVLDSITEMFL